MATKTKTEKPENPKKKKQRPDLGQGSKGNFGADGDWGKESGKSNTSSPVPPSKAD